MIRIRHSEEADLDVICEVHRNAFGEEEGPEIVMLVRELFADESARPILSLLAEVEERIVGHVLFTAVHLPGSKPPVSARILAPLAAQPAHQGTGVGGALIRAGLERLAETGVGLVFVLGHMDYYPRFGFRPVGDRGLEAPYPIPDERADAWMVQALQPGLLGCVRGTIRCARALDHPEYW